METKEWSWQRYIHRRADGRRYKLVTERWQFGKRWRERLSAVQLCSSAALQLCFCLAVSGPSLDRLL